MKLIKNNNNSFVLALSTKNITFKSKEITIVSEEDYKELITMYPSFSCLNLEIKEMKEKSKKDNKENARKKND